ncbi:hypothetical protein SKAU_G00077230 [Synaphobranchus kaupii]|uniref:Ig-like domain-containing protein n=1 Tax=Synaphobranchus kaupii TaxID=118154 RepID=A0A9Q1G8U2_SYNKA|nr:hypothetical protein SKAU_G00077230 [Synaphobranchus kaupii]
MRVKNAYAGGIRSLCSADQLKQLQAQILLEQREQEVPPPPQEHQQEQEVPPHPQEQQQEQEVPPPPQEQEQQEQEVPPPSPPLPPPPSFQELENSEQAPPPMITASTMQTASTFNYARPKQFIAAQSPGTPSVGYNSQSSVSSGSSLPSPLSPSTPHKAFSKVTLPSFQPAATNQDSPSSPTFPPPPPPFLSPTLSSPAQDFPPPPPPPPPPAPALTPSSLLGQSHSSSPFGSTSQSPAGFLVSVLPQSPPPPVNALGLPKGNGTVGFSRKASRTPRMASDSEIQGSKDAVMLDLERKLRFKEERLSNGQQRLTYEEKMARRLLGADSAATVFNVQATEEEPNTQDSSVSDIHSVPQKEYKVSSFEQRLISEIEFRLERSPVEESDDDVEHDEDAPGQWVAPFFSQKLKHLKVFEGTPVTFSCKVIGDPKPKIYWFKDGKQISGRNMLSPHRHRLHRRRRQLHHHGQQPRGKDQLYREDDGPGGKPEREKPEIHTWTHPQVGKQRWT